MQPQNDLESKSDIEHLLTSRRINNTIIYVAIAVIGIVATIAMLGVYFGYW